MAREDDFSKHSSRKWEDCGVFETSLRHRPVPCLTETKKFLQMSGLFAMPPFLFYSLLLFRGRTLLCRFGRPDGTCLCFPPTGMKGVYHCPSLSINLPSHPLLHGNLSTLLPQGLSDGVFASCSIFFPHVIP